MIEKNPLTGGGIAPIVQSGGSVLTGGQSHSARIWFTRIWKTEPRKSVRNRIPAEDAKGGSKNETR